MTLSPNFVWFCFVLLNILPPVLFLFQFSRFVCCSFCLQCWWAWNPNATDGAQEPVTVWKGCLCFNSFCFFVVIFPRGRIKYFPFFLTTLIPQVSAVEEKKKTKHYCSVQLWWWSWWGWWWPIKNKTKKKKVNTNCSQVCSVKKNSLSFSFNFERMLFKWLLAGWAELLGWLVPFLLPWMSTKITMIAFNLHDRWNVQSLAPITPPNKCFWHNNERKQKKKNKTKCLNSR